MPGRGVKLELAVDTATGLPVAVLTAPANTAEVDLASPLLAFVRPAVELPGCVPVLADAAYDSDPLRRELLNGGFRLLSPHRKNRVKPPSNDGRRMRRYKRRYVVERTFGHLKSYRRVGTRFEWYAHLYDGFVHLACALVCLSKL